MNLADKNSVYILRNNNVHFLKLESIFGESSHVEAFGRQHKQSWPVC